MKAKMRRMRQPTGSAEAAQSDAVAGGGASAAAPAARSEKVAAAIGRYFAPALDFNSFAGPGMTEESVRRLLVPAVVAAVAASVPGVEPGAPAAHRVGIIAAANFSRMSESQVYAIDRTAAIAVGRNQSLGGALISRRGRMKPANEELSHRE